jgi:hypothetical protein
MATSSLVRPDRHAGKIVVSAAYGDPSVLSDVLLGRIEQTPGDFKILENLNVHFATSSTRQSGVGRRGRRPRSGRNELVRHWVEKTGCVNVVFPRDREREDEISGLHALESVERARSCTRTWRFMAADGSQCCGRRVDAVADGAVLHDRSSTGPSH